MKVNLNKTKCMVVKKGYKFSKKDKWWFGGRELEKVFLNI